MNKNLTKDECILAIAKSMWINQDNSDIFDSQEFENIEQIVDYLNDEISTEIEYESFPETEEYKVYIAGSGGGEGDGAMMYIVFGVVRKSDNCEGYIKYHGRYSSWDSSYYGWPTSVEPYSVIATEWKDSSKVLSSEECLDAIIENLWLNRNESKYMKHFDFDRFEDLVYYIKNEGLSFDIDDEIFPISENYEVEIYDCKEINTIPQYIVFRVKRRKDGSESYFMMNGVDSMNYNNIVGVVKRKDILNVEWEIM